MDAIPDRKLNIPNPIDRIVQREKDRKAKLSSFKHPMAKVHAMDLFDIRYQLTQLCDYLKGMVPALRPLARLVPGPRGRIDPMKLR